MTGHEGLHIVSVRVALRWRRVVPEFQCQMGRAKKPLPLVRCAIERTREIEECADVGMDGV